MKLYEIHDEMTRIFYEYGINEDTKVNNVPEDVYRNLESLQLQKEEKIENLCMMYKNSVALEAALKEEKRKITERIIKEQDRQSWVKYYLVANIAAGEKILDDARFKLSWRKSKSCEVYDPTAIPDTYVREKVIREPDKKQMLEDLKAGASIPGAALKERNNIQIG